MCGLTPKRILLPLVVVLEIAAVYGCASKGQKPLKPSEKPREPVNVTVINSSTTQEDETGKPMWKIFAAQTRINEAQGQASVKQGQVQVYSKGELQITLVFPNLAASAPEKRLYAWGGVRAASPVRDTSFRAQSITIDLRTDRLTAKGSVRGSSSGGQFQADTLESDLKFKHIRLSARQSVKGIIGLPGGKGSNP